MDIIMGMGMGTITTINHHKVTTQTCPRNPLSGHEKAMLSYNRQHGFFISIRTYAVDEVLHIFFPTMDMILTIPRNARFGQYNMRCVTPIYIDGHVFFTVVLSSSSSTNTHPKSREYILGYPIHNRGRKYLFGLDSVYFHSHIVGILGLLWLPIDFPERCSGSIL